MHDWQSEKYGITRRQFLFTATAAVGAATVNPSLAWSEDSTDGLRAAFAEPPMNSRPWVYWWWLEGVVTKAGLSADLEEMHKQGISGVLIFDAGRTGPTEVKGAKFMSEEWREYFRHAVGEAARLGMEVGLSLCTGWDAGGLWVEREDAIKLLTWREKTVTGPGTISEKELKRTAPMKTLGGPLTATNPQDWYRDLSVVAAPVDAPGLWDTKTAINLTATETRGERSWQVPEGTWTVMQFGYVLSGKHISLPSSDQLGWEIDPMSAHALENHFRNTAAVLVKDVGQHAGKTFKYTHIDSWEIGQPTWTQDFIVEFKKRRGYDPLPYLPALAAKTVIDADTSKRFWYDYRRTVSDLVLDNYYGRLGQLSHEHGMGTHSEAGGPFYLHYLDGLAAVGSDDIPMGEFWSTRERHDQPQTVSDDFFRSSSPKAYTAHFGSIKQASSATHIYGRPFCQAEAFTGFDRDWTEDPYHLKADGDRAFCLGLGRIVIHHYASVPDFGNAPGNQWEHVSIHFNRYLTWWNKSHAWLRYLGRCQHMLRQGDFVADILYYAGEAVPNFVLVDKKKVPGFDYDSTNADALLKSASVVDGRITFGHGTSYRYLVIPGVAGDEMTVAVVSKLRDLVRAGATLIATPPKRVPGLAGFPVEEQKLHQIVQELWGDAASASGQRTIGGGRVIWGKATLDVITADRMQPDVEVRGSKDAEPCNWIHRRHGDTDIYFVANHSEDVVEREFIFRASGRQPELWDATTGTIIPIKRFKTEAGRTVVPMKFEAKQSFFVVFAKPASKMLKASETFPLMQAGITLDGPWTVRFDPAWGAPAMVKFDQLQDWTKHSDDGVRHYSGEAVYEKTFEVTGDVKGRSFLDLGSVKNLAQVYLNGKDLGVVWTAPWRVETTGHLVPGKNDLRIEVVNLWPNRLIKDGTLPKDQQLTKTNVRTYEPILPKDVASKEDPIDDERRKNKTPSPLLPSGLMGPVTIQRESARRS